MRSVKGYGERERKREREAGREGGRENERGLPAATADWTNAMMRAEMHARLGAMSGVCWLDEQEIEMIAEEVLGGGACSRSGGKCSLQPKCDATRMLSWSHRTYTQRF